jgi:hypothetical protein
LFVSVRICVPCPGLTTVVYFCGVTGTSKGNFLSIAHIFVFLRKYSWLPNYGKSQRLASNELMGKKFQAAQLTHEIFLTKDIMCWLCSLKRFLYKFTIACLTYSGSPRYPTHCGSSVFIIRGRIQGHITRYIVQTLHVVQSLKGDNM